MGKTLILKSLLRSPNSISFVLIIFTFKLIQTIRILWFCHRSVVLLEVSQPSGARSSAICWRYLRWVFLRVSQASAARSIIYGDDNHVRQGRASAASPGINQSCCCRFRRFHSGSYSNMAEKVNRILFVSTISSIARSLSFLLLSCLFLADRKTDYCCAGHWLVRCHCLVY
jgi:hypothetical protein